MKQYIITLCLIALLPACATVPQRAQSWDKIVYTHQAADEPAGFLRMGE